jgi:hypothetical protein
MANDFSKEEKIAFEKMLEGFHDQLVMSNAVNVWRPNPTDMQRSYETEWRPMPYILGSVDGTPRTDISSSYQDATQLTVPVQLSTHKAVPWTLDALELRDALYNGRLGDAAKQRLASDINVAVLTTASNLGSLVVKRTAAFSGFDDVAACEAVMNETGVPDWDRNLALTTRDYNSGASNLAARETMAGMPTEAYRKAYIGEICNFSTLKLDYGLRLTAAAPGASVTMDTRTSATANFYVPKSKSTASTGEKSPVDNRFQTITTTTNTGVKAGDAFTIANVYDVHKITKSSTGQLKTFRVVSLPTSTTMVITPPIISAPSSPTDAEKQYKNCETSATSATAAITFLNIAAAGVNPFWFKDAIELIPGSYAVPGDAGPGMLRARTDNGVEVVLTKSYNHNTMVTEFAARTYWGTALLNPEMAGILICGQA